MLIFEMIKKWEDGAKVVFARRRNRHEPRLKKITAYLYYYLLEKISDIKIHRNIGDFRLIDKSVLKIINKLPEKSRYLRGMVDWAGYHFDYVYFSRPDRKNEKTSYTWKKMFRLAIDGITGFSILPLQIAKFLSFIFFALGAILTGATILNEIKFDLGIILSLIMIAFGVQSFLLWIIGEYLGRIFENIKNRPLYIIKKRI